VAVGERGKVVRHARSQPAGVDEDFIRLRDKQTQSPQAAARSRAKIFRTVTARQEKMTHRRARWHSAAMSGFRKFLKAAHFPRQRVLAPNEHYGRHEFVLQSTITITGEKS
jgi:hypothetical protein